MLYIASHCSLILFRRVKERRVWQEAVGEDKERDSQSTEERMRSGRGNRSNLATDLRFSELTARHCSVQRKKLPDWVKWSSLMRRDRWLSHISQGGVNHCLSCALNLHLVIDWCKRETTVLECLWLKRKFRNHSGRHEYFKTAGRAGGGEKRKTLVVVHR